MQPKYNENWPELAQAYVDKHKNEPGWLTNMLLYYTNPDHPCRIHEYTQLVIDYICQKLNDA